MKGLNIGDPVTVEKNGTDYSGAISEIGSMVDASTGLFKVKATLGDADGLASGTMVKVYVTAEKADNVMVVPADCVNYSNGDATSIHMMLRQQQRKRLRWKTDSSILTRFRSFPDFPTTTRSSQAGPRSFMTAPR